MTTKHKPATPLPWESEDLIDENAPMGVLADGETVCGEIWQQPDAAYIAHVANAYPRLVDLAQAVVTAYQSNNFRTHVQDHLYQGALSLLAELGE